MPFLKSPTHGWWWVNSLFASIFDLGIRNMTSSPGQFAPSEISVVSTDHIQDGSSQYGSALPQEEYVHSHCDSPPQEFPLAQVSEVSEHDETEGTRFIAMEIHKLVTSQHFLECSAKFRTKIMKIIKYSKA